MNKRLIPGGLAAALALSSSALAEVKLNEYLSLTGYVVGAYTETDFDPGPTEDTFFDSGANIFDSAKVMLIAKSDPLSVTVSGLYIPEFTGANNEVGILDAFVSYNTGAVTITAGKFLSYLGYEAFDPVNMTQLTYGLISGIPAYHSGLKFDFGSETYSAGFAVVDSVNPGDGFFRGDGEFEDDIGFEAFFTYKGVERLTVFAGIGAEDVKMGDELFVFDLWASYALTEQLTVAAEYVYNHDVATSWLAFAQYAFTPKFYTIARISGIDYDAGGDAIKYTIAPTFVVNDNLSLRAEYSMTNDMVIDNNFFGVQAVFKF